MKTDLKISILSIVSVLCATFSVSSYAASSVRALGGAGTYDSASSAAVAKASGTKTAGANAVRAGSMRVGGSTGGTRVSSTRGAATPRLSIGKYLGGSTVVGGGSSTKPITPGQSGSVSGGSTGKLQERVEALEQFVGYSETGAPIKDLILDVETLQADLKNITGKMTVVNFKDGFLTIVQDGETVTDVELVSADDLQSAVDALIMPVLNEYAKSVDVEKMLNASGFITSEDLAKAQEEIAALRTASDVMNSAIENLRGGVVTKDDLKAKVQELKDFDADLQAAILELDNKIPVEGSFVNKDYVEGIEKKLLLADVNLQSAISSIEEDVGELDGAIGALNELIISLQSADEDMAGLIAGIDEKVKNAATKSELEELRELINDINAGDVELANYYTKQDVDNLLNDKADLSDLDSLQDSIEANAEAIAENLAGIQTLEASVENAAREAAGAKSAAELNATGIEALNENLKSYVKIDDLAVVATTGSYKSLIDADDLITSEELDKIREELEDQIGDLHEKGEYATAEELRTLSDELAALPKDVYTKTEIDDRIAKLVTNGELDLSGYVKTTDLGDLAYKNEADLKIGATQITSINGSVIEEGTITALQIENNSITADKFDTGEIKSGEMAMLIVGADGVHEWVSITVDEQ